MSRFQSSLWVASMVVVVAGSVVAQTAPEALKAAAEGAITPASIGGGIKFLADDLLEGRGPGSRGDQLARAYLAASLHGVGVKPGAADGGWNQAVPITGLKSTVTGPLTAHTKTGDHAFVERDQYTLFAYRPDEETKWDNAEVVFVGYGITAPDQKWDDFKDVDVKGKVLLVMNNDPSSDPALFAGKTRLYYGRWSYKYEEAARRGAVGAIVIHTEPSAGYPFQVVQSNHGQERFWLPFKESPSVSIAAWMTEDASRDLAKLGGFDLDALRAKAEARDFRPQSLGVTLSLATKNAVRTLESGNVVGVVAGSDPKLKDEAVVISAHFDHLGIGPEKNGDRIYNGALDNASGCGAMLALARAVSMLPTPPRRSIVFLAVTGEEQGLLGSEWYANNPTWPAKKIVANFNIDGINIWGRTRDVQLIGHGKSSLTKSLEAIATAAGRRVLPDSEPDKGLFYRSDHFSFARVGIPSVYMKSGMDFIESAEVKRRVQLAYTTLHYHQPSDQFDARWNLDGAAEDMRLLFAALIGTADADAAPTWTPGDEFEHLR